MQQNNKYSELISTYCLRKIISNACVLISENFYKDIIAKKLLSKTMGFLNRVTDVHSIYNKASNAQNMFPFVPMPLPCKQDSLCYKELKLTKKTNAVKAESEKSSLKSKGKTKTSSLNKAKEKKNAENIEEDYKIDKKGSLILPEYSIANLPRDQYYSLGVPRILNKIEQEKYKKLKEDGLDPESLKRKELLLKKVLKKKSFIFSGNERLDGRRFDNKHYSFDSDGQVIRKIPFRFGRKLMPTPASSVKLLEQIRSGILTNRSNIVEKSSLRATDIEPFLAKKEYAAKKGAKNDKKGGDKNQVREFLDRFNPLRFGETNFRILEYQRRMDRNYYEELFREKNERREVVVSGDNYWLLKPDFGVRIQKNEKIKVGEFDPLKQFNKYSLRHFPSANCSFDGVNGGDLKSFMSNNISFNVNSSILSNNYSSKHSAYNSVNNTNNNNCNPLLERHTSRHSTELSNTLSKNLKTNLSCKNIDRKHSFIKLEKSTNLTNLISTLDANVESTIKNSLFEDAKHKKLPSINKMDAFNNRIINRLDDSDWIFTSDEFYIRNFLLRDSNKFAKLTSRNKLIDYKRCGRPVRIKHDLRALKNVNKSAYNL